MIYFMVSIGVYDVVFGERERRRDGLFRKLIGKAFNILAHYFANVTFWDMDKGLGYSGLTYGGT